MVRNCTRIKKRIYLACEGGDVGTEGRYIYSLCQTYSCMLLYIRKDSLDPKSLADAAIDFAHRNAGLPKKSEIWIVFDNDFPEKARQAFELVKRYNNSRKRGEAFINIAFNSPVVETWGLLSCGLKNIPDTKERCQSELHRQMPKYIHQRRSNTSSRPEFDFTMMEAGYSSALKQAQAWHSSLVDQEEYSVTPYAGIFKLVKSIKN